MSVAEQVAQYVDMLPDSERVFALELVKRLVLAWDPDFTKLTAAAPPARKAPRSLWLRGAFWSW
ncbi:MAG: hypothetical protein LBT36_01635 [Oscillospiraceae bacterium]|nr:hypothetical protein [Oscillospiraceae bacterium]